MSVILYIFIPKTYNDYNEIHTMLKIFECFSMNSIYNIVLKTYWYVHNVLQNTKSIFPRRYNFIKIVAYSQCYEK